MYLPRNTYVLLDAVVRMMQLLKPLAPLRDYARDLVRKLADIRSPEIIEWGVISDASGTPVASIAVSELKPCQIEELEDTIRAVIRGW